MKYLWKGFLQVDETDQATPEADRNEKYSEKLYIAASCGDLVAAASALSHGGSVEWTNPKDGGKTALHKCVVAKRDTAKDADGVSETSTPWLAVECAEFLLQNGAKIDVLDAAAHGVLVGFYPSQAATLDATYATYLADNGQTGNEGLAVGEAVSAS